MLSLLLLLACSSPKDDTASPAGPPGDEATDTADTSAAGDTGGEAGGSEPARVAGFRASRYGISPFPSPGEWVEMGESLAGRFEGARPAAIWIVGVAGDDGSCLLNFPGDAEIAHASFRSDDQNEDFLAALDEAGFAVWLEVEPGEADVAELLDAVMARYAGHPSVVGFGVDAEWLDWRAHPNGRAVTDEEARAWLAALRSYLPDGTLLLKHWLPSHLPPGERDGLLFVDDSQDLGGLDPMLAEFGDWGEAFSPAPVAFQVGYEADRSWWSTYEDPAATLGDALFAAVPSMQGFFWVDFTLDELFAH